MKVLIVVPWDQEYGGVASVVGNLARYLTECQHDVCFFHPGKSDRLVEHITAWGFRGFTMTLRHPFEAQRPVRSIASFICCLPFTLTQLLLLIRRRRIDVINVHYPIDAFICFAICRILLRKKLVVSIHGADLFPSLKSRARDSWSMRFLLRAADSIVAPSEGFLKDLVQNIPTMTHKTTAIHNGLNLEELGATEIALNGARGNYVLCIAQHAEKKGLDDLIRAFALINGVLPNLRLMLVGDGPLRHSLEDLADAVNIKDVVEFLGWKTRREVAQLLHGCVALVLPSKSEPFGIVVIEAMACKKPVVATRVGGIPEIIEDGKNGILVPPGNPEALAGALTKVLVDPRMAQAMGEEGYYTVHQQFTYKHTGRHYQTLFNCLLARSN